MLLYFNAPHRDKDIFKVTGHHDYHHSDSLIAEHKNHEAFINAQVMKTMRYQYIFRWGLRVPQLYLITCSKIIDLIFDFQFYYLLQSDHPPPLSNEEILESNDIEVDDIDDESDSSEKPWFFRGGTKWPKPDKKHKIKLFPHQDSGDRIGNQLMYLPPNYEEILDSGKMKTILLYNGLGPWDAKKGREAFTKFKCPVNTCTLTSDRNLASTADMLLYKDHYLSPGVARSPHQIYMLYLLECPYHTQYVKYPSVFNWTATYRTDSDIVTPYEKWHYFNPHVRQMDQERNFAYNKTKKVAWFVSNCGARNGRLAFAQELKKYIQVDIYGACGSLSCSRTIADSCFDMLDQEYKFYLAFENSNCKDYITEKVYVNALKRSILPIVMGAPPEDYEKSAPYRSYIHVDEFATPKELAEYLHILDKNDDLYNSYFKWKGTGEFINTFFWCRLCAMLHNDEMLKKPKWYNDINEWWRGKGICTNGSWRKLRARSDVIPDDDYG